MRSKKDFSGDPGADVNIFRENTENGLCALHDVMCWSRDRGGPPLEGKFMVDNTRKCEKPISLWVTVTESHLEVGDKQVWIELITDFN